MTKHRHGGDDDAADAPSTDSPAVDADAIFGSFVANAYAARPDPEAPPAAEEARWAASVEQLLDFEDAVTEVGARPLLRAPAPPTEADVESLDEARSETEVTQAAKFPVRRPFAPASDTDVTRAAVRPKRRGESAAAPLPAPPPAGKDGEDEEEDRTDARRPAMTTLKMTALEAAAVRTESAVTPDDAPPPPAGVPVDPDSTNRILLLTQRKPPTVRPPAPAEAPAPAPIPPPARLAAPPAPSHLAPIASPEWKSVVRAPSTSTQRREALLLVPEVAKVEAPTAPPREGSEDGMMPGGELDRKLGDMAVLLRYGHEGQVRGEIDALLAKYPRDLLMLRRIAEFWIGCGHTEHARELLFTLATGLFERRNVEGMRQALEQVLVLEPGNERALRLIALLDQRPGAHDE